MTRIATKSRNDMRNAATVSIAKDVRYWSCARTRAAMRKRYRESDCRSSATLHDQASHTESEEALGDEEEHDRPAELDDEDPEDLHPRGTTDEDVDRELDHRRERSCARDGRKPVREERHRDDEPREEVDRDRSQEHGAAVVGGPKGDDVVDRAERVAHDDREQDADREREPLQRTGRQYEPEHERTDEERRQPAIDRVIQRAPEVERERCAQWMHRSDQISGDVAGPDAQREVLPAEDVDRHDQCLAEPHVGHRGARVVAGDAVALFEQREEDVRTHETEDGVHEDAGDGGGRVRRIAGVATPRELPVEPKCVEAHQEGESVSGVLGYDAGLATTRT